MKTDQLIKVIMTMIIITVVMIIAHPTVVSAKINNISYTEGQKADLLEIKSQTPIVNSKKSSTLKLNYTVEELRQVKEARKKAEELERQKEEEKRLAEEAEKREAEARRIVYDGLTMEELSEKLNRSLNSTLSGKGETFARLSDELGIDPYLAVAIVMHETGCKWDCSNLLKTCNNVGGMKGSPGCGGGAYASFPSLDEGIRAYMNNLNKNYFSVGLTTPEAMGPKYAASTTWAVQVRAYMNEIKAK